MILVIQERMKYHQYNTDSTTASSDHQRIRVAAITTSRTSTSVSIIQEILKHILVSSIVSFKQQQQSTTEDESNNSYLLLDGIAVPNINLKTDERIYYRHE